MAARNFTGRPTNVLIAEKKTTIDGVEYGFRLYRNTAAKKVSYIIKRKVADNSTSFWTTLGTFDDIYVAYLHFIMKTCDSATVESILESYDYTKVVPVVEETTEDNTEEPEDTPTEEEPTTTEEPLDEGDE